MTPNMMTMMINLLVMIMHFKHASSFDYYKLALQWPPGVCETNVTGSNVPSLLTAMDTAWPQLLSRGRSKWGFWSHEWDEHGRFTTLRPSGYFQDTIDAYNSHDPLNSLRAAAIVPDDTKTYKAGAFQKGAGGDPGLKCIRDPKFANSHVVVEIKWCFDKTTPPRRYTCYPKGDLSTCGGISGKV
ncbi:Ribonuclease MC, partial [Linum grandiflorum]